MFSSPMAEYGEIMVWRWVFTNALGKRVESDWHIAEHTVAELTTVYRDAAKVEGSGICLHKSSPRAAKVPQP